MRRTLVWIRVVDTSKQELALVDPADGAFPCVLVERQMLRLWSASPPPYPAKLFTVVFNVFFLDQRFHCNHIRFRRSKCWKCLQHRSSGMVTRQWCHELPDRLDYKRRNRVGQTQQGFRHCNQCMRDCVLFSFIAIPEYRHANSIYRLRNWFQINLYRGLIESIRVHRRTKFLNGQL